MRAWLISLIAASGCAFFAPAAEACDIPVFRYALERWPADPFEVMVFHRGKLSDAQQAIVAALRKAAESTDAPANLSVEVVDVDGQMSKAAEAIWKTQKDAKLPWLVVRYPESPEEAPSAWAGPLESADVAALINSPARRQIASRILKGDSVVWLVLESGERAKDDAAVNLLETQLRRLEKELELPKIDPEDDTGPRLRSALPVKLAFSTLRISRTDAAEKALITMLINAQDEPLAAGEPAVFAIFGRGRVLPAMSGRQIKKMNIEEASAFLTGACSCQVKALNPGIDLLMSVDWDGALDAATPDTGGKRGGP